MSEYLRGPEKHNVTSVFSVNGFSLAGRGQNMGVTFVNLAPWDERKGKDNTASAIAGRPNKAIATNREARGYAFIPPAVLELGNPTGVEFELQDQAGIGHDTLPAAAHQFPGIAARDPDQFAVIPNRTA